MNKTFMKRTAIVITAISLAALPVFAKTGNRGNWSRDFDDRRGGMPCDGFGAGMGFGRFGGQDTKQTMGVVSSVNKDNGMITVTDVDGKDTQIHINPATRIIEDNTRRPELAEIGSIKKDDWVMVSTFNTDTKTSEAAFIFIRNK